MTKDLVREQVRSLLNDLIEVYPTMFGDLDEMFPEVLEGTRSIEEDLAIATEWLNGQPASRVAELIVSFVATARALTAYR
jgi:hypothetical protein